MAINLFSHIHLYSTFAIIVVNSTIAIIRLISLDLLLNLAKLWGLSKEEFKDLLTMELVEHQVGN